MLAMVFGLALGFAGAEAPTGALDAVGQYYDAMRTGDRAMLEAVFHDNWHMKDERNKDGILLVETKTEFIGNVTGGDPIPGYSDDRYITDIQIAYNKLAIIKNEKPISGSVTFHTAFNLNGEWKLASKIWTSPELGRVSKKYQDNESEAAVRAALKKYYDGVTNGDVPLLHDALHPNWHMKDTDSGKDINSETQRYFVDERVKSRGPYPGYNAEREISELQIIYDQLALVRVDKPSTRATTFFFLMKLNGEWKVIEKSWATETT